MVTRHCKMLSSEAIALALNDQNWNLKYMLARFQAVCWRGLKCGVYIIGMVTSHRSMVTLGGRPTLRQGVVHSLTTPHLYKWQDYEKPQWYYLFRSQSRYWAKIVIVITQGEGRICNFQKWWKHCQGVLRRVVSTLLQVFVYSTSSCRSKVLL